jgi:hypothetical protein
MSYRVLFIGNSHTYLHYMPQLLTGLARSRGTTVLTEQCIGEGASLAWHWNGSAARNLIQKAPWTHVVLQERSRGALEDGASMHRHALLFDRIIRNSGAQTVLFMTWAARGKDQDQSVITKAYQDIAQASGAMLAPVGRAWKTIVTQTSCKTVYHRDGRHAGKAGAYLTACVFYALLCNDTPIGLSGAIEKDGKVLAALNEEQALLLQEAARNAVAEQGESDLR